MTINKDQPFIRNPLVRETYLQVVQASLAERQYRFAREIALHWLTTYPGDLGASLLYGQALLRDYQDQQAQMVFRKLFAADPESLDVVRLLSDFQNDEVLATHYFALSGRHVGSKAPSDWGDYLWQARQALAAGDLAQAEDGIRKTMKLNPQTPLTAITHLSYLAAKVNTPVQMRLKFASHYHRRWPDCLVCALWLADWMMEGGDSGPAVVLLHQTAARDISGQVARRLWGEAHPYRKLWPDRLELSIDIALPADVAGRLGWNLLTVGGAALDKVDLPEAAGIAAMGLMAAAARRLRSAPPEEQPGEQAAEIIRVMDGLPTIEELGFSEPGEPGPINDRSIGGMAMALEETRPVNLPWGMEEAAKARQAQAEPHAVVNEAMQAEQEEMLRPVREELERLAERFKIPGVTRLDGRYPVYVVFSVAHRLQAVYGKPVAQELQVEMERLVETVKTQLEWDARLFLVDDQTSMQKLGLSAVGDVDPWKLKLALTDLDVALSRRGEMIGAVLIVGGPEIVPFHRLPNPINDQDNDVPSDNPYATRDENYFIPEWPVGRLPGGEGKDATLLLEGLREMSLRYVAYGESKPFYRRWWSSLTGWMNTNGSVKKRNFGYTAAIWRAAAASVFNEIGNPKTMRVSPPLGLNGAAPDAATKGGFVQKGCQVEYQPAGAAAKTTRLSAWKKRARRSKSDTESITGSSTGSSNASNTTGKIPVPVGQLGYFNLHGLEDAAEWYGQSDPLAGGSGMDYPVALRPKDVQRTLDSKVGETPRVVFSEACYGANILGKRVDDAIALKFLEVGSHAVVGSTCMAYGSIDDPLIAADLLGEAFWRLLRDGLPAGEALRRAKINLAREMNRRQGYLDGEDQKTLISFVLYGDPLAMAFDAPKAKTAKGVQRMVKSPGRMKTVCDRCSVADGGQSLPPAVVAQAKQLVVQYLPGMVEARVTISQEREGCGGSNKYCPVVPSPVIAVDEINPVSGKQIERQVLKKSRITLSKQVEYGDRVHQEYARMAVDADGNVVKLVVSK